MRIAHLSTGDSNGGAARAAFRLHRGLREEGTNSSMFVRDKRKQSQHIDEWSPNRSLFGRLKSRVKRRWLNYRFQKYQESRPDGLELFSQAQSVHGHRVAASVPPADVYNLHWINDFIDPLPFFQTVQQPVVWTLHDMNVFTGGCHYTVGCRQFEDSCGKCPQLGSESTDDLSRTVWKRKREAYEKALDDNQLHIVASSEWLSRRASESALLAEAPMHVIPLGLDPDTFQPRETEGLRTAIEIPPSHRIVLFVAQSVQNRRKGFDLLAETLSSVEKDEVSLLSVGGEEPEIETVLSHTHLGTLESDLLLSVFYSLADVFVIPSRQEAFGQTALESMACGTPVVGFDTGGIPDMVRPGETGWLAEVGDVRALRRSIETALSDDETRNRLGRRCREVVENEYTLEVQANRYRDLYEQLLNQNETIG